MPRDSNGVYTLPAGYLAVTGETILASQHNPPLEDIADALTASLPRNGAAPMTAPLKLADGTAGAPSLAFNTAPTYGWYKSASGVGASINGTLVMEHLAAATVFSHGVTFKDVGDTSSANPLVLGNGNVFNVTGTTGFASISTKGVGTVAWLRFAAALTITHHSTDLVLLSGASITTRAGDMAQFEEYASGDWRMTAYHRADGSPLVGSMARGGIDGLIMSNGTDATNDINIAAGRCRDSTDAVDIVISTALGKQLDANWAVGGTTGTPAGGRNSAAGIANTTYHVWAVRTAASSAGDIYFHTSADAATVLTALQLESGGASYIYARRIGSIIRESAAIVAFFQEGDRFTRLVPIRDYSQINPGTSAVLVSHKVPTGIKVIVIAAYEIRNATSSGIFMLVTSPDQTDTAASSSNYTLRAESSAVYTSMSEVQRRSDTSGRVRFRLSASSTNDLVTAHTDGWIDSRGKDA